MRLDLAASHSVAENFAKASSTLGERSCADPRAFNCSSSCSTARPLLQSRLTCPQHRREDFSGFSESDQDPAASGALLRLLRYFAFWHVSWWRQNLVGKRTRPQRRPTPRF